MISKVTNFLILCILAHFISCAVKFGQINDCHFYDKSTQPGCDNVTFICAETGKEQEVFNSVNTIKCSKERAGTYTNKWPGTVDFQNCRFTEINRNFFEIFPNMQKFIISDVNLETLSMKIFSEAKNITHLIATHNQIAVIPSHIFFNANELKMIDFSWNKIQMVDSSTFVGANKLASLNLSQNSITKLGEGAFKDFVVLKQLNMSHNNISQIGLTTLPVNLMGLDVSNNNLTNLDHLFDKTTKLINLDLAFNPIGNVKIETFAYMPDLQYLNLRHTNMTSIRLGTFSHQQKLISLDFTDNRLKKFDFNLFIPILPDLISLSLAGNQLNDLSGFNNELFPQLTLLDIKGNDFNCTYLVRFMKSVNWEKLRLLVDPESVKPGETSIRSIKCQPIIQSSFEVEDPNYKIKAMEKGANCTKSTQKLHNDFYLIFLSIIMLIFLILFAFVNRTKFFGENRERKDYRRSSRQNVEYKANDLLLD